MWFLKDIKNMSQYSIAFFLSFFLSFFLTLDLYSHILCKFITWWWQRRRRLEALNPCLLLQKNWRLHFSLFNTNLQLSQVSPPLWNQSKEVFPETILILPYGWSNLKDKHYGFFKVLWLQVTFKKIFSRICQVLLYMIV